jgi:hypothetical protein
MRAHVPLSLLAALFLLAQIEAAAQDTTKQPTAEDVAKAEKAVKEQLENYKAAHGQVKQVKDEAVAKAFPSYTFFAVLYRQFPVGRVVPKPLKPANLFAVGRDFKPKLLNDVKELENFFRTTAVMAKEVQQAKAITHAWLTLSPELRQDGFYQFKVMDDSTKVAKDGSGMSASGKVVVMRGGNGAIDATLRFDSDGKLVKVDEKAKIRPGPRPICQATKLLDKDPLVRRMAEQDLLYLGRLARPYLDEQRAKATPELRRAIDRLWQRILEEED